MAKIFSNDDDQLDGVDVVATDLKLRRTDGLELLGAIREGDRWLPVLLVTARATDHVEASAIQAGASDFVGKPLDIDDVAHRLVRALDSRARRRSAI